MIEDFHQEYLQVLQVRREECREKVKELVKEAKSWPDDETQDMYQNMADIWRTKVDTLNYAIRLFEEIVLSQA